MSKRARCRVVDLASLSYPRAELEGPKSAKPARWFSITNAADGDEARVSIFDEIGFWGVTAGNFADELNALKVNTIQLHINSPGGEVYDGLAIYNTILQHPAEVHVTVDGLAASAASFIAMAGDTVTMARNAEMMIHDAIGLCWGNAAEMRKMIDMLDRCSDNIADIYAQRAGGTVTNWRSTMQEETWYGAQAAVDAGLADKVLSRKKATASPDDDPDEDDSATNKLTFDLSAFRYAGVAAFEAAAPPSPPAQHDHDLDSVLQSIVGSWSDQPLYDPLAALRMA